MKEFNYPLWDVTVNGRQFKTESTPDTGQMLIPVGAGENRIRIRFVDGPDRNWGLLLSGIGFAIVLLIVIWTKPHPLLKAAN
jgi:hypothetical protein